ncbi:MAG: recombinase family protein [Streptosporangiaceae bacterium]
MPESPTPAHTSTDENDRAQPASRHSGNPKSSAQDHRCPRHPCRRVRTFTRSIQDLITIVAGLRRRGIGFTSLHEALDTTTPGGRLIFHVFAERCRS